MTRYEEQAAYRRGSGDPVEPVPVQIQPAQLRQRHRQAGALIRPAAQPGYPVGHINGSGDYHCQQQRCTHSNR